MSISLDHILSVLAGGSSAASQYNSNSTSTQFVLVSGACTLVRISNTSGFVVSVFDASSTGQPASSALINVPAQSVTEVDWPMQNGVVLQIPPNSLAAVSYST